MKTVTFTTTFGDFLSNHGVIDKINNQKNNSQNKHKAMHKSLNLELIVDNGKQKHAR